MAVLPRGANRLAAPSLPGVSAALTAAALAHAAPARVALAVTPGPADHARIYADLCALGHDSGVTPESFPTAVEDDVESIGTRARVITMLAASGVTGRHRAVGDCHLTACAAPACTCT